MQVTKILKRMGRRTTQAGADGDYQKASPGNSGHRAPYHSDHRFPGETQEDHEELMEFVDEMEFDRLGVFTYSPEEDTPAADYAGQVPKK